MRSEHGAILDHEDVRSIRFYACMYVCMYVRMYIFKNIVYGAVGGALLKVAVDDIENLPPEDKIYLNELVFQNYLRRIHTYIRPVGDLLDLHLTTSPTVTGLTNTQLR